MFLVEGVLLTEFYVVHDHQSLECMIHLFVSVAIWQGAV